MEAEMKKIAMIGAGPATLYGIQHLYKLTDDVHVEVFDANDQVGGAIYTGIPDWRMNKTYLTKLRDELVEKGVVFHMNTVVGKDISFQSLREQFDRVVVGIGAQIENMFHLEAKDGCIAGLTLLHDLNMLHQEEAYRSKYKKAVVWGAGNVAMDVARSLKRLLPEVAIVYRRGLKEMPANLAEIRSAQKENIEFRLLENIEEVIRDDQGYVVGVKVISMELGEPDASGRASFHPIADSEHIVDCDLVVAAVGQKVDFASLDPNLTWGENGHQSSLEHVYILGDAYTGPKTIGIAVMDGKKAIEEILASF